MMLAYGWLKRVSKAMLPTICRSINANPAVRGRLGVHMDLSMAIDGLIFKRAVAQDVIIGRSARP